MLRMQRSGYSSRAARSCATRCRAADCTFSARLMAPTRALACRCSPHAARPRGRLRWALLRPKAVATSSRSRPLAAGPRPHSCPRARPRPPRRPCRARSLKARCLSDCPHYKLFLPRSSAAGGRRRAAPCWSRASSPAPASRSICRRAPNGDRNRSLNLVCTVRYMVNTDITILCLRVM